jgi:hypothetical protein
MSTPAYNISNQCSKFITDFFVDPTTGQSMSELGHTVSPDLTSGQLCPAGDSVALADCLGRTIYADENGFATTNLSNGLGNMEHTAQYAMNYIGDLWQQGPSYQGTVEAIQSASDYVLKQSDEVDQLIDEEQCAAGTTSQYLNGAGAIAASYASAFGNNLSWAVNGIASLANDYVIQPGNNYIVQPIFDVSEIDEMLTEAYTAVVEDPSIIATMTKNGFFSAANAVTSSPAMAKETFNALPNEAKLVILLSASITAGYLAGKVTNSLYNTVADKVSNLRTQPEAEQQQTMEGTLTK